MIRYIAMCLLLCSLGCHPAERSGWGFTLPVGDVDEGCEAYTRLQCNACHKIEGVDQLAGEDGEPEMSISLGGKVPRISTYGELVTSVINPSHRLAGGYAKEVVAESGESKMRNYNDVMTVTELNNIVEFLQSKYEIIEPEPTEFPEYGP